MVRKTVQERFYSKVRVRSDECWEWTGARIKAGYGIFSDANYKTVTAHKWAYRWIGGLLVPRGKELDHRCKRPWCVNPAHLRPVTPKFNSARRDMTNIGAPNRNKTHCPHGHSYKEHGRVRPHDKARVCTVCESNYRKRKRDAA